MLAVKSDRYELEHQAAAVLELRRRKSERTLKEKTVYGIVCPKDGLVRCWQDVDGEMQVVDEEPDVQIPLKLERTILTKAAIIILEGGRGSAKSETISAITASRVKDYGRKIGAFREFQISIEDSVHSILQKKIDRLSLPGFKITDTKIDHDNGGKVRYRGLSRNTEGVKSMDGFTDFWGEEAQTFSARSIELLEPTLREEGSQIWYSMNRGSSADPIFVEHIAPYEEYLLKNGIYEDEDILVISVHYTDNPWFPDVLEKKRKKNKLSWSTAKYEHVWDGKCNDEVENSIIKGDWFDAAVDVHKIPRLAKVFEPHGAKVATHDPSDEGSDAKAYSLRHASIFQKIVCKSTGDVENGCSWATSNAINDGADWFIWDGDGMGSGLKFQVSDAFFGKPIKHYMFKGSLSGSAQDNAKAIYMPTVLDDNDESKPLSYADTFLNNRSQHSISLRNKFYNTYRCVVLGEYVDPTDMISIDSEGVLDSEGNPALAKLRSEVCRVPKKPNNRGLIQIMSKKDMALLGIISPNMYDSMMMNMFSPKIVAQEDLTIPMGPRYG